MKLFFFDTETNGLPKSYNRPITDSVNWPRLVQIGWIVADQNSTELESRAYIVKPVDFEIPAEVAKIHRVTMERANREGILIETLLSALEDKVKYCDAIIGHNIAFDLNIVRSEFHRHGIETNIDQIPAFCTMKSSTSFCEIPGNYGRFKWPTLSELYQKLFSEPLVDAHDAYIDIAATASCYFRLVELGVMDIPAERDDIPQIMRHTRPDTRINRKK